MAPSGSFPSGKGGSSEVDDDGIMAATGTRRHQISVVKINAIAVPEGGGPELEKRFAARLGAVENMPGFEGFELLRPTKGEDRYFVYTRWASEEHFQQWVNSEQFRHGHQGGGGEQRPPVGTGSALLEFEVVERV